MARTLETFFAYYDSNSQKTVKVSKPDSEAELKDKIGGYPVYGVIKDGEFRRVREYVLVPGWDKAFPLGGLPPKKDNFKK